MKKLLAPILLSMLVIFVILLYCDVFKNNNHKKIDTPKSKTQSIELERSKEFSVIKVIEIIPTASNLAVDAFGDKIKINEWYVQSNITRVIFPINTKSTNYTNLGWLMANGKKELAPIQITNGEPLGFYVKAEILLLDEKTLALDDLEKYQIISIK